MSDRKREKLDIVLELDCERGAEEVRIGSDKLGQIIEMAGITDVRVLRIIIDVMQKSGMALEFNEHGKQISAESYTKQVEKQGKWSRAIEAGGLSFRFGRVPALKHCFVSIEEVKTGLTTSWSDWVRPFLAEESFVQAWISDVEYDYWQNAKDLLQYEEAGLNYSHLPMKSNGLPPPLEQIEIDTSNNPGRWTLQLGYVEAIGSTMWLGKSFWRHVGENRKDRMLSADWLDVRMMDNDVIQMTASKQCFCDETTEDIQNNLRVILYS